MRTSRSNVGCQGWRLLCFSAIAILIVVSSSLVCLAQEVRKLPDVKDPFPNQKPGPPPPKKPGPATTPDRTACADAPAGAYFSDCFSGSQLGPDWKLMNGDAQGDPQRWTMQPKQKSLLIQTQTGTLSDSKKLKNWLILNKDLPADDFEVIVEASIQIEGFGNHVLIALFADDQNYFWVGFEGANWSYNGLQRVPHFVKVSQGKSTPFNGQNRGGPAAQPERIFLKIERQGNQYSGFYAYEDQPTSIDQIQWAKMGTLPWINFHGKLVLSAANFYDAPEVAAEFYSVLIRKK